MRSAVKWCAVFICVCLLGGCGTAPPELYQANKLQQVALERVQEGRVVMIEAYTKELVKAYSAQLDLIADREIAKAQVDGVISVETAKTIMAEKEARRLEIEALLAAKREEFLVDDNLETVQQLNVVTGAWIKTYVEDFAGRIDQLIQAGQSLLDGGKK